MNPLEAARAAWWVMVYCVGAAIAFSVAVLVIEATIVEAVRRFRARRASRPAGFDPCGLLDYQRRPCLLPADHAEHEHATMWQQCGDRSDTEGRHRFDDTATEGRYEYRIAQGLGYLPRVTRDGDTVARTDSGKSFG